MKTPADPRQRILLAEDALSIRKLTARRLEHEGFEVVQASDGEEALDRVEQALPIHVVLLDVDMPKLNGYEVCRMLKLRPATAHIPVIIYSATEPRWQELANRCIELGAAAWLKKPFRTQELVEKIRRALEEQGEGR